MQRRRDVVFSIVDDDRQARMKVVGVGGSGGNAINRMIEAGLEGVDFIAVNTDVQALEMSRASERVQIGSNITRGLGAGANPEVGRQAIGEDRDFVSEVLEGSDMVFVTAGMGGGTGTGAAPIIAEIAKEQGALTVGIVTKPFLFEGRPRMRTAEDGIAELKERVDTLIVIPNERLLSIASEDTALGDAFRMVDEVLLQATRGISDLISVPGVINLDFNDVKTVMLQGGDALMGVGGERGEDRAQQAAQQAIESPLLEDISIAGAKAVLVNISGANNMTLMDFRTAATTITEAAGEEANIILGTAVDEGLGDEIRVTVIATGFNGVEEIPKQRQEQDAPLRLARPPRGKERDVPTYMRQRKQVVIEDEDLSDVRLDDLEAPTFLRKKQMNGQ